MRFIVLLWLLTLILALQQHRELPLRSNYIPSYFLNSSGIATETHRQNLFNWLNYGNPRTHLLWRGTEHSFNWTSMHNNVDNWGAILVLIKTNNGFAFEGFISSSLTLSESYIKDPKAFIFSLTRGTVHYQRNKTANVFFDSKQYISFGDRGAGQSSNWDDISLRYSCNVDYWSYSDFGWAFIPPEGIVAGTSQAQSYMAGSYTWMCSEVQIWAVIQA